MAVTLLTVSEYARHRACDEKAVRKALDEGRISRIGSERRCIDPDVADIQWAKNTRARADSGGKAAAAPTASPAATKPASSPETAPGEGYQDHRTRRERAEALMAELELEKASGKTLDREAALRSVFAAFRQLRDSGMVLGRRMAPMLAAMTDPREIRIAIDRAQADVYDSFAQRTLQSLVDGLAGAAKPLPPDLLEPAAAPADDEGAA